MGVVFRLRLIQISTLVVLAGITLGDYVITTPRKWSSGQTTQICFFAMGSTSTTTTNNNSISVVVETYSDPPDNIITRTITFPPDVSQHCSRLTLPNLEVNQARLKLDGDISGQPFSHRRKVKIAGQVTKTFVQTDKYLYKPGQEVQLRILTISGPLIKVSTNHYPLVWIETPQGSRIAQWVAVPNPSGLIHLSFKLSEEPEKGVYKIHVDSPDAGTPVIQNFEVDEYVLPRFEVTITPPKLILGSDEDYIFNVCAKYTYGQPVKGNVSLSVNNQGWGSGRATYEITDQISGCKDFNITATDLSVNGPYYHAHTLQATAIVTEDGTGEQYSGSSSTPIHRTVLQFKLLGDEQYIKPSLPYTARVKITFPDGSIAAREQLEVCSSGHCKEVESDESGIVSFIITNYEDQEFRVTSLKYLSVTEDNAHNTGFNYRQPWLRRITHKSEFRHQVRRYFSPSKSGLVIHAPTDTLPCSDGATQTHNLPILIATTDDHTNVKITVQVVSRGQIQFTSSEYYEVTSSELILNGILLSPLPPPLPGIIQGTINIPLTLPPSVSPTAKVIVWFSRSDGEVVSDVRKLNVKTCFTNPVSVSWSQQRAHPGDQVDINLLSEPLSLCSLGVVDKSVELLSTKSDPLTENAVFGVAETAMVEEWENAQVNDKKYCEDNLASGIEEPRGPPAPPGRPGSFSPPYNPPHYYNYISDYVDALKMFDVSGLHIFTDLITETRPCKQIRRVFWLNAIPRSGPQGEEIDVPLMAAVDVDHMVFDDFAETSGVDLAEHADDETSTSHTQIQSQTRTYFPETWLWQLSEIDETGSQMKSVTLPHTITEWVGKAVCVHPLKGLGISQRASVVTYTPFFIDLTLPPSVKRGEIMDIKISVFNYLDADLPVKVVVESSDEYDILDEQQILNEHELNEMEGADSNIHDSLQLRNGERRSCVTGQDKTVHTVKIRATTLGLVNITVWAEVDALYPQVCGPEYVVSRRDHLIKPIQVDIEGFPKEKTWTKYMCSKDIEENADYFERWLIEAPSNIISDSARGWITAVGDLLGPTLENLGSLIKMPYGCGEQNMLNFAPNIFILQYLEATHQTTPQIADKAIEYMKKGYQRELQYRHSVGSYSAFGSSDASGSTWLTAFVLKSFAQALQFIQIDIQDINMSREWLRMQQMENGCFRSKGKVLHKGMKGGIVGGDSPVPLTAYILISLLESTEPPSSQTVSEAAFCLVADKSNDPYTLALKSYALALADDPRANAMLQDLIAVATETATSMYWPVTGSSGNNDAVSVETSGYAILAMTTLDPQLYEVQSRKIIKWISSMRNGQGGFISTQDTVVALQALASFEAHQHKDNVTDLVVMVEAGTLQHNFHIDNTNKLLVQSVSLPPTPTSVILDMEGTGCALIQSVLRYNIPEDVPSESFSLSVETETSYDLQCATKLIKICASYQLPDQKSNMAVIEINLVSGYIPKKEDLKRIVGYGTGLFKRYEVDGSQINLYVDEFSAQETCIELNIIRVVDIEDVKPGTVKVYDYYQPELFNTKRYTLPPTDECVTVEPEVIIEGIIVDPVYFEYDDATTPSPSDSVDPAAIDDLLDIIDLMP